ncbi:hypothetical protein GLOIN_2v1606678 [Rhizophagus irregularis DAOM 181602=DAOM 197198]|uniref:Uncharacterized protein n=1 Tax=Rhizophagus irregularis (strain DAOM 181602 / DAOM 197198 / MUCL 43194) TaxID=747089 RepID=A0A2P4Q105_RHIID|nr:hypothetical protein GLOIN_2v1606678 [Rhizophagus irregularis DAOM 181602=DAOM 197198]POG71323.1 hypothetical protein GLOIN_2v1606678 [Rhizophagus irregularis DAOM 181602=DAOM 197198]GBC25490.2 hypothetical protein GLOIN_2v1606678 [Rhizophagus irregularis DAOM 181602=DAOM 197198]|eukprot:XP_025178189.1 hypothetical protein GLOIN_2v1606678 [Rhizophagus irregularis DAOM 181602=DAOM 197198]
MTKYFFRHVFHTHNFVRNKYNLNVSYNPHAVGFLLCSTYFSHQAFFLVCIHRLDYFSDGSLVVFVSICDLICNILLKFASC